MTNERTTPAGAEMQKLTVARPDESATPAAPKAAENTREAAAAPSAQLIGWWDATQSSGFRWKDGIVRSDFPNDTPIYAVASVAATPRHDHTCHDGDDCVACDAEQSAAAAGEQATLIAKAREHAFHEAASVDAKVIAMLMAAGKVSREDVDAALAKVAALQAGPDTQTAPKAGERVMYIFLMPGDVQLATDEVFSGDISGWVRSSPAFVGHKYMDGMSLIRRAVATLPDVSPPAAVILPPMPDPAELLEIARATGLRSFLHGVNASDAREILENYLIAVDGRRSTLPSGSPQAPGLSE
ncbi:hypothetical protein A9R05_42050 (plasmid) [Burkholderia sp. KK1]|uniref:Uncharacterized protein n=1 Tax=Burkholderia sp. M701 TaxID=326454 RepID=V5YMR4_9BURK|nr:hypothetical protein [Burkholderia sp. M701]AQH05608.1 hypothetical protein A9R05_42050 [Burkholderia sp. KK1]BAO18870.1 hypothetical protein [Burkholderia sp. M701]